MSELKPCPFCGGSDIVYEEVLSVTYCNDCGGELDEGFGSNWQNRPIEDALTARIAELEYQLEDWTNNGWAEDYNARIAELEAENVGLKERVAMLEVTAVFKSLGEMGYIEQTNKLHTRIAELESLVEQLIWVGNDLLVSNTNPVTITLFNGLVCNAKERAK